VNKKNHSTHRLFLVFIAVGAVVLLASLLGEATMFPWSVYQKNPSEQYNDLPDPATLETNTTAPAQPDEDSETADTGTEPEQTAAAVLPGDETESGSDLPTQYTDLGILKIPVLNVSAHLLEGTGQQMNYGVGHVAGTDAAGAAGNCAVAGHRSHSFRYLDRLKAGNKIFLNSSGHIYTYTVFDSFSVLPNEVWVLDDVAGEPYCLTLITCTPYLVSSHRLIVRARLTEVDGVPFTDSSNIQSGDSAGTNWSEEPSASGTAASTSVDTK
jgi:LPXTG-site transpeptidase (sortase) family protein